MKQLTIANSWHDITLQKFEELERISKKEYKFESDRHVAIIAALSNWTEDEVLQMTAAQFTKVWLSLSFLQHTPDNGEIKKKLSLNGHNYRVTIDIEKMIAAQFFDYSLVLQNSDTIDKARARELACFVTPEGKKYGDGTYSNEEVVKDIYEHLTVDVATTYALFFYAQYQTYARASIRFLGKEIRKNPTLTASKTRMAEILQTLKKAEDSLKNGGWLSF